MGYLSAWVVSCEDWLVAEVANHTLMVLTACRLPSLPALHSGCRAVWYCGTACSHADWRAGHKRVCKALGAARQAEKEERRRQQQDGQQQG